MSKEEEKDEQDWDKAIGQFRLYLGVVLEPLQKYGQAVYVAGAEKEIVQLALQLHYKLYGVDMPFNIQDIHW